MLLLNAVLPTSFFGCVPLPPLYTSKREMVYFSWQGNKKIGGTHIYTYTDTKKRGFQIPGVYPHMKEKFPNLHLLYNHGEQAQPPLA